MQINGAQIRRFSGGSEIVAQQPLKEAAQAASFYVRIKPKRRVHEQAN